MKKEEIKKLGKQGWKVGSVSDFLKLSREEEKYIEMIDDPRAPDSSPAQVCYENHHNHL